MVRLVTTHTGTKGVLFVRTLHLVDPDREQKDRSGDDHIGGTGLPGPTWVDVKGNT